MRVAACSTGEWTWALRTVTAVASYMHHDETASSAGRFRVWPHISLLGRQVLWDALMLPSEDTARKERGAKSGCGRLGANDSVGDDGEQDAEPVCTCTSGSVLLAATLHRLDYLLYRTVRPRLTKVEAPKSAQLVCATLLLSTPFAVISQYCA
jgi:hypothetical protein